MMMIEITIISSSSVKPRDCGLRRLPVTILLSIQRFAVRFRMNVEDVLTTPGVGGGGVIAGSKLPIRFARHRIDGNSTQVHFDFRLLRIIARGFGGAVIQIATPAKIARRNRQNIYTLDQGVQIRWKTIGIVGRENRLVGNRDANSRVTENVRSLLWVLLVRWISRSLLLRGRVLSLLFILLQLRTGDSFAMKLIDGLAHFAQGIAKLHFLLTLYRNLHQRHHPERQNREHRNRDHEFN